MATMLEKYAFSFALSKRDIANFYYDKLVWTLARYKANDHIIITFAEQTHKSEEINLKLDRIKDFHKPYIIKLVERIPEKYKVDGKII